MLTGKDVEKWLVTIKKFNKDELKQRRGNFLRSTRSHLRLKQPTTEKASRKKIEILDKNDGYQTQDIRGDPNQPRNINQAKRKRVPKMQFH